ncbi:hypothetical protein, partial [Gordonia desulfuricans]|uniref:hypothetical protein n=1 Tax=Gordonia desulfuricans TaxID=89051 RepID=UPI001C3F42E0
MALLMNASRNLVSSTGIVDEDPHPKNPGSASANQDHPANELHVTVLPSVVRPSPNNAPVAISSWVWLKSTIAVTVIWLLTRPLITPLTYTWL